MSALDLSTNLSSLLASSPATTAPVPLAAAIQSTDFNQHLWRLTQPHTAPAGDPAPASTVRTQPSSDQNDSTQAANNTTQFADRRDSSRDASNNSSPSTRTSRSRDQHSSNTKNRKSSRGDENQSNDRSTDATSSKSDSPPSSANQKESTSTSRDKPTGKDNAPDASDKSSDDRAAAANAAAVLLQTPAVQTAANDSTVTVDSTVVQATDNADANANQVVNPAKASADAQSAATTTASLPTTAATTLVAPAVTIVAKDAPPPTKPSPAENAPQSQTPAAVAGNVQIVDAKQTADDKSKNSTQEIAADPTATSVQANAGIISTQISPSDQLGEKTQPAKSETSSAHRNDKTGANSDDTATTSSVIDQVLAAVVPPAATTTVTSADSKPTTDDAGKVADRTTSAIDRATDKTPVDAKNPQSNTPVKLSAAGGQTGKPGEAQASTLSEADRARFVQRVARAVQSSDAQNGPVKIRLSPPELGSMKIEVVVKDGVMSAKVETETPQARTALLDNLPQLRERLAEQNIKVERFDVDLMNQQPQGGMPDQRFADATAANRNRVRGGGSTAAGETVAATGSTPSNNGQLNIVI